MKALRLLRASPWYLGLALLLLMSHLVAPPAIAQAYPARPITLIVGFAPGGSADMSARAVAGELSKALGATVIVENRPGAGGRIGTKSAALAAPDGYTLLWGTGSSLSAAPVLYGDEAHVATLMPISLGATQPFVFAIPATLGVKTLDEFVALAKQRPGAMNFASAGIGGSNHLLGEIFMDAVGINLTHVPYNGAAQAMQAVIGGQAHLLDEVTAPIAGAIEAGQLVPLFVTSATPDARFPKIPTALDVKLPNMLITGYYGLLAPQGTSPEVIQTLNRAMQTALKTPAVTQVFGNLGFKAEYSTPAQMAERIASVKANYQRIVTERGIKVQ